MGKIRKTKKCCFCSNMTDDEFRFGKFHERGTVKAHYFCLLLSTNMWQNGEDNQGILGFLLPDVKRELKAVKTVSCFYCEEKGASIYCSHPKCRRVFHLPCGLKHLSLHQFFGQFKSFCGQHRPVQKIDKGILKNVENTDVTCATCHESVIPKACPETILTPCCKGWIHRNCVQNQALNAGYFFKCPLCNNEDVFEESMKLLGIYIPERDASWEEEPNAFAELLEKYSHCDAKICRAKSRSLNLKGKGWEIITCKYCGSQGIHKICGNFKAKKPVWGCPDCCNLLKKDSDDEDEEIDVESLPPTSSKSVSCTEMATQQQNTLPAASHSSSSFFPGSEEEPIIYNIITDVQENMSVVLSSSDSDVEVVNYTPKIKEADDHKYQLRTHGGNYVEVLKLNETVKVSADIAGDVRVPRRKKVIQIDDSDIAEISEPESVFDFH